MILNTNNKRQINEYEENTVFPLCPHHSSSHLIVTSPANTSVGIDMIDEQLSSAQPI